MAILVSDILKGAYQLLGRPAQSDLPYQDLLDCARRSLDSRFADRKLAARNHTQTIGSWVVPTDRDMSALSFTGGETNVIPIRMEWRTESDDEDSLTRTVEIVSYESMNDLYRKSGIENYVAFYNGFNNVAFADPIDVLQSREYRFIFESMDSLGLSSLSGVAEIAGIFLTMFELEVALMALDLIINLSPEWAERRERLRASLTPQWLMWDEKYDRLTTTSFGQKKVTKLGYRPRMR